MTPLDEAVRAGHEKIAQALLSASAEFVPQRSSALVDKTDSDEL